MQQRRCQLVAGDKRATARQLTAHPRRHPQCEIVCKTKEYFTL